MITRAFVAALFFICGSAVGQAYPSRPVKVVVPFAAGGAVDTVARLLSQRMSDVLRQPVLVDNRPGAGGIIASELVARSPADGYTLLMASISQAVTPSMYKKLPFDAMKDIVPVSQITTSALVLTASPKLPATSLQALVAMAKQKPGSINYGSTGVGTSTHLAVELLNLVSGANMVHVPYKGDAPQINALMSGEVQIGLVPSTTVLAHIQGNRLRALAVTGIKRLALLPDVPTLVEAGFTGLELNSWIGLFAPAGVPAENLGRFQGELARVLATQEIKTRFTEWGYDPVGSTPQEFTVRYQADVAIFARVIREARIPFQE